MIDDQFKYVVKCYELNKQKKREKLGGNKQTEKEGETRGAFGSLSHQTKAETCLNYNTPRGIRVLFHNG